MIELSTLLTIKRDNHSYGFQNSEYLLGLKWKLIQVKHLLYAKISYSLEKCVKIRFDAEKCGQLYMLIVQTYLNAP